MEYQAGELLVDGNKFTVQRKRKFLPYDVLLDEDIKKCFDFAYGMSYAEKGEHRDSRSGGTIHRTKGQIFINTFQGKVAEFALCRYLINRQIDVAEPDTKQFELGRWDSYDLACQGKYISVKSTKSYGELLLLETKDWNVNGEYIPNIDKGIQKYDYIVLVRVYPDGEKLMRDYDLLYQNEEEIPRNVKSILIERVCNHKWQVDFPGFIYYTELVKLIQDKCIIPQGALLNGKTKMDAENYYFQIGNMHSIEELYRRNLNEEVDVRANLRLKRRCPNCGNELVLRMGKNNYVFWGCKGYTNQLRCEYRETLDYRKF